jgi:hypothetical protein
MEQLGTALYFSKSGVESLKWLVMIGASTLMLVILYHGLQLVLNKTMRIDGTKYQI